MSRFQRSLAAVLLVGVSFAGGAVATQIAHATTQDASPYNAVDQLARVLVLIENDYVEPIDRERLIEGSIEGMVGELDPHSAYLPPEDYTIFRGDAEGKFGGIGVEVDFSARGVVTIIAPIEGSPADRAGIKPGDQIVAIDNQSVRGKSSEELVRQMRGKPGTDVLLTIRREGVDELQYVTLTREVISVASIRTKLLKDEVAYIRIKTFQSGTHTELLDAVAELRQEAKGSLSGVLLDLRNNPGGFVHEAQAVADEFLSGGLIYTTRHRGKVVDEVWAKAGGALRRGPVVVLVNEYSASASELVAGALQDNRLAPVVGAQTFGKGSVQTIIDLPGGAGLRLTTMRYYTPDGRAIQAQGIEPDVQVEASYASDKSFGIIREEDLKNHLPAEGPPGTGPEPDSPSAEKKATQSPEELTHLGVARTIPEDPTQGPDFALSIGYQIVTGVLKRGMMPEKPAPTDGSLGVD